MLDFHWQSNACAPKYTITDVILSCDVKVQWMCVRCLGLVHTSLERFMSRSTLMTMLDSVSEGRARFMAPSVLNTDKMFLKPKS